MQPLKGMYISLAKIRNFFVRIEPLVNLILFLLRVLLDALAKGEHSRN